MRNTESLQIENDRSDFQEVCSDCEAYRLKKYGLTRYDCSLTFDGFILITISRCPTVFGRDSEQLAPGLALNIGLQSLHLQCLDLHDFVFLPPISVGVSDLPPQP